MSKIINTEQAVPMIPGGAIIGIGGFIGPRRPQESSIGIEESFLKSGYLKDLTITFSAGIGDGTDRLGLNKLGHEGLLKHITGGHWGLIPKLWKLISENKIEDCNPPFDTISLMFRDITGRHPGTITKVGLKIFIDPRIEGARMSECSKEGLIELVHTDGEERLRYKSFPLNVALIRTTYYDEDGNITMEKEAATLDSLSIAQAAENSGGIVLLQMEKMIRNSTLDPRKVKIPEIYVDGVVVTRSEDHWQIYANPYDPALSGGVKAPVNSIASMKLNKYKVIYHRAAMEPGLAAIVNLGIGMPEGVASVANEGGSPDSKLATKAGGIDSVPNVGTASGTCINSDAIIDQPYQFNFYDRSGLGQAFLGPAECSCSGNVSVSRFGLRIVGCGGFINITQASSAAVHCDTFTVGELRVEAKDDKLYILQEGGIGKFKQRVEQITSSIGFATETGQKVLCVTEHVVSELLDGKPILTKIVPGVDLGKGVLGQMELKPAVADNPKTIDGRLFREKLIELKA